MKHRQIITTPFTNRSFQQRPKVAVRKHNLVPLTRPNRATHSQPRKINVGPLPELPSRIGQLLLEKLRVWQVQQLAWLQYRPASQWPHHPLCLLLHLNLLYSLPNTLSTMQCVPDLERYVK